MKKLLDDSLPKPTENPWQILHSQDIYENPWIKVREDKVINPSGKEGIYGTVSFKNKAIGIIPIDEQGFTWLVGQYRYPLNEYSWEIPMGGGKVVSLSSKSFDEQILEAAQRELWEETGILAEKWTKIARIHTSNSVTDEEGFVFVAENLSFGSNAPEETEQLMIKKVHLSTALQWVITDEITDAISMIGILKVCKLKGITESFSELYYPIIRRLQAAAQESSLRNKMIAEDDYLSEMNEYEEEINELEKKVALFEEQNQKLQIEKEAQKIIAEQEKQKAEQEKQKAEKLEQEKAESIRLMLEMGITLKDIQAKLNVDEEFLRKYNLIK